MGIFFSLPKPISAIGMGDCSTALKNLTVSMITGRLNVRPLNLKGRWWWCWWRWQSHDSSDDDDDDDDADEDGRVIIVPMMMMLMKMAVIIVPSFLFLRRVLRILNAPWLAPTLYLTISSTILYYTINHTILYHQPFYTINHTIPSTIPYHILNWVGLNNTELQRITV